LLHLLLDLFFAFFVHLLFIKALAFSAILNAIYSSTRFILP